MGLKQQEERILSAFNQIVISDGIFQKPVPAIYGDQKKFDSFCFGDDEFKSARLPAIALYTSVIGPTKFKMEGTVYAAYRTHMTEIVEQFYSTIKENGITVSEVTITQKENWPTSEHLVGKFTITGDK